MKEIWKDIKGYEGLYQISNYGRVKSLPKKALRRYGTYRNVKERILKTSKSYKHSPYSSVIIRKDGVPKTVSVHRLVAEHFIPNPKNYKYINHKDENKLNNRVDNLEWCSAKYNANYGTSKSKISNKRKKAVIQYSLQNEFIAEYDSLKSLKELKGFDPSLVSCVCRGIYKQAYGYKFKYKEAQ